MTDEAAFEAVSKLDDDLARDLVSRPLKRFSNTQLVWLHVLANGDAYRKRNPKK